MKILFCGHGRAGKDTACEYLASITGLKNAGTCSLYLAPHIARRLGVTVEEAYGRRHESDEMRMLWYNTGEEIRQNDPALLVREMLSHGDIGGGVRGATEINAVREQVLADLIVWVDNRNVPSDPTMMYGPECCDVIIENHWGKQQFFYRLDRLAKAMGIYKGDSQ